MSMHSNCSGRLGRDPELKTLPTGTVVCNFSIAVQSDNRKNAEGGYDTDWYECSAFGKTGEFIHKYFKKGGMHSFWGTTSYRTWQKDDETVAQVSTMKVDSAEFGATNPKKDQQQAPAQLTPEQQAAANAQYNAAQQAFTPPPTANTGFSL